jgi:hypothetical protein
VDQEAKHRHYELAETLLSEQNFVAAVIVGAVATLLAAAAYGIVVAKWNFSYGFAAAGIGIAVGLSMQYLGRGIEMKFSIAASLYALAGCVLGNVFRVLLGQARSYRTSPLEVLGNNEFAVLADRSISYISFIDLVFWLVAVWFAVFLVKRPLSRSESLALGMYELKD